MNKMITSVFSFALLASPLTSIADDYEPEQLIKYRHDSMEAIKYHNNAIKLILQGKVPYTDQLDSHMSAMDDLMRDLGTWFPEGSDFGETDAKEAIWDNPEKFAATVKKAQDAYAEFRSVVNKGDNAASAKALKRFGKASCGNCHKSYKKKDD